MGSLGNCRGCVSRAAFMIQFLVALLREGAPSICFWVAPAARRSDRLSVAGIDTGEEAKWQAMPWPASAARGASLAPGSRMFVRLRIEPPWQSR